MLLILTLTSHTPTSLGTPPARLQARTILNLPAHVFPAFTLVGNGTCRWWVVICLWEDGYPCAGRLLLYWISITRILPIRISWNLNWFCQALRAIYPRASEHVSFLAWISIEIIPALSPTMIIILVYTHLNHRIINQFCSFLHGCLCLHLGR